MSPVELVPANSGLTVTAVTTTADLIAVAATASAPAAPCPACGHLSPRLHSRYRRTLADLAVGSRRLVLIVTARKFRCTHAGCDRCLFCERLEGWPRPAAAPPPVSPPCTASSGSPSAGNRGAWAANALAVPTSADTLLRRVTTTAAAPVPAYQYVGIDNFALRKGRVYGTVLIDLERGRVIDLLPGRDGTAIETWLKDHPGVQVITRTGGPRTRTRPPPGPRRPLRWPTGSTC